MDRTPESFQECLEILETIFDMPIPREEKCESLWTLAQIALPGCIVELGTFHGNGFITLTLASNHPMKLVFTVDDYSTKKGWSGESYGPLDKHTFNVNCNKAGVAPKLCEGEFTQVAQHWNSEWYPISLLFWDAGSYFLFEDINNWIEKIIPGGILAIHDTYDGKLGALDYIRRLLDSSKWDSYTLMPGGVHMVRKKKD